MLVEHQAVVDVVGEDRFGGVGEVEVEVRAVVRWLNTAFSSV